MTNFSRKLLATTAAGVIAVGSTGVSQATNKPAAPLGSDANRACSKNIVFTVAATNLSHPSIPDKVDPLGLVQFSNQLRARGAVVKASPYDANWGYGQISYLDSLNDGIKRTEQRMQSAAARCPNAKISLVGYSEGADVIAHITQKIGANRGAIPADRLGGVVPVGNPSRSLKANQAGNARPGEGFFPPADYGTVSRKVLEICDDADSACNTSNTNPGARDILVKNIVPHAYTTPQGFKDTVQALHPALTSKKGRKVMQDLPSGLAGIAFHATNYWANPKSPLKTQAPDFILSQR